MGDNRLFKFQRPAWLNSATTRTMGVYSAGAIFSLALFTLIDAATFSATPRNGSGTHLNFVDWIPGICSALGMLIINSIDKARLAGGDNYAFASEGVAWKARLVLFLGFALMAGGLAGSVTVMVLKYVIPRHGWPALWFGVANVIANAGVMLSSVVLWVAENMEDDYQYNLAL